MRHFRFGFALIFVGSLAAATCAQTAAPEKVEALKTLRRDLVESYRAMRPCLPIYEGHRANSEGSIHQAEEIVKAAITAVAPPTVKPVAPVEKPKAKATAKKAEAVKPAVAAKPAEPTLTEEQKIAASQAGMRKALEAIQKAQQDLKAASDLLPDGQAANIEKLLQTAEGEATKAIALHASQG